MTARRSRGDGGLHWDETQQRWIASVTVGYSPAGKRIAPGQRRTKTEAKNKLRDILRATEDGHQVEPHGYTVKQAVEDWLAFGLAGRVGEHDHDGAHSRGPGSPSRSTASRSGR